MYLSILRDVLIVQYGDLLLDIFVYVLVVTVLFLIIRKIFEKIFRKMGKDEISMVQNTLKIPLIVVNLNIAILLPFLFSNYNESVVTNVIKQFLLLVFIFTFAWLSVRLISAIKHLILGKIIVERENNFKYKKLSTQFKIIEKIAVVFIIFVTVTIALMLFEPIRHIGISLFTSAGVAGIIIGLAAQKIISTVLAGVQVAITQPIRIDDVVIVENEWGAIEEINLTHVVVKVWDKRRLVLPTTYFIEKPFQNWTRTSTDIMGTVFLYTDYTMPFDELKQELNNIVKRSELWDGEVCRLAITNATDKVIEIRATVSAQNSIDAWELRLKVREELIRFIQKKYPECLPKTRVFSVDN